MKAIREELGDEEDGQEEDEMAQLATKVKKVGHDKARPLSLFGEPLCSAWMEWWESSVNSNYECIHLSSKMCDNINAVWCGRRTCRMTCAAWPRRSYDDSRRCNPPSPSSRCVDC